jgi:hypothetical protein
MVIVQGVPAATQLLLHPVNPQQLLKNRIVKVTGTGTQLGAGKHGPKSVNTEILFPVQVPGFVKLQNQ